MDDSIVWPSTLPPCPILGSVFQSLVAAGADHIDKEWKKMEPNTMDCDIPVALRFCASAAKTADAHWMRAAADEVERLRLTDAEREAVRHFAEAIHAFACPYAATLRALLERTKCNTEGP
jgi:hypothetical protein